MHALESVFITIFISQVLGVAPFRIRNIANKIRCQKCFPLLMYSSILAIFIFFALLTFMSIVWEKGGIGNIQIQNVLISKWLPLFLDYFLSLTTSGFTMLFILINVNSIVEALSKLSRISQRILYLKQIKILESVNIAMIVSGFVIHISMTFTVLLTNPFRTSKIYFSTGFVFLSEVVPIAYTCQFCSYVILIGCYYTGVQNFLIGIKERSGPGCRCVIKIRSLRLLIHCKQLLLSSK